MGDSHATWLMTMDLKVASCSWSSWPELSLEGSAGGCRWTQMLSSKGLHGLSPAAFGAPISTGQCARTPALQQDPARPRARSHTCCSPLRWGGSSALLTAAPYPAATLSPQRLIQNFTSLCIKLRSLKLMTSVLAANQADPVLPSHAHYRNPSLFSSVRAENDCNCVLVGNYHEIALGHRLGACHMFHYLLKDSCCVLGNIYKAKLFTALCLFLASMQPERH